VRRRFWIQLALFLALGSSAWAESVAWVRAYTLYQQTDYSASLNVLLPIEKKDAAAFQLIGQDEFMLGDYHKATESLEHAVGLAPDRPDGCCGSAALSDGARKPPVPLRRPVMPPNPGKCSNGPWRSIRPIGKRSAIFSNITSKAPGFLGGGESKRRRWRLR